MSSRLLPSSYRTPPNLEHGQLVQFATARVAQIVNRHCRVCAHVPRRLEPVRRETFNLPPLRRQIGGIGQCRAPARLDPVPDMVNRRPVLGLRL
jgi:hypothetical protein